MLPRDGTDVNLPLLPNLPMRARLVAREMTRNLIACGNLMAVEGDDEEEFWENEFRRTIIPPDSGTMNGKNQPSFFQKQRFQPRFHAPESAYFIIGSENSSFTRLLFQGLKSRSEKGENGSFQEHSQNWQSESRSSLTRQSTLYGSVNFGRSFAFCWLHCALL